LDEATSAKSYCKEEKMTKQPKSDQNKPDTESPRLPRHPTHDHQIIRKDSDDRKVEKTTDWNKPPRPKEK
jgi:hypothetical protein